MDQILKYIGKDDELEKEIKRLKIDEELKGTLLEYLIHLFLLYFSTFFHSFSLSLSSLALILFLPLLFFSFFPRSYPSLSPPYSYSPLSIIILFTSYSYPLSPLSPLTLIHLLLLPSFSPFSPYSYSPLSIIILFTSYSSPLSPLSPLTLIHLLLLPSFSPFSPYSYSPLSIIILFTSYSHPLFSLIFIIDIFHYS